MDIFMDKLSQKLTAQEMIKANAAADAEEMKKMQMQIEEYRKILDDMQEVLNKAEVNGEEIVRLMEEGFEKLQQVQNDTRKYDRLRESISELEETSNAKLTTMDEKMGTIDEKMAAIDTRMTTMDANVHKECVKVYRNVQAVVVEENAKHMDTLDVKVRTIRDELQKVLKISTIALIAAVGSLVFQLLVHFNVL